MSRDIQMSTINEEQETSSTRNGWGDLHGSMVIAGPGLSPNGAIINLVNTVVGVGLLSLPYAASKSGFVLFVFLAVTSCIMNAFSVYMIMEATMILCPNKISYRAVVRAANGPVAEFIIKILLVIHGFGTASAYARVLGDVSVPLMQFLGAPEWAQERNFISAVFIICIVAPISYMRSVRSYTAYSLLCLVVYSLFTVLLVVRFFLPTQAMSRDTYKGSFTALAVPDGWEFLQSVSIVSFAFSVHNLVHMIFAEVSVVTTELVVRTTTIASFLIGGIYCIAGVVGFAMFGQCIKSNIFNEFDESDKLITAARFMFAISIAFTLPLYITQVREVISWFRPDSGSHKKDDDMVLAQQPISPTTRQKNIRADHDHRFRYQDHSIMTAILLGATAIVALLVPKLHVFFDFVGSIVTPHASYVFPALCFLKATKGELHHRYRKARALAWMILYLGIFFSIATTVLFLYNATHPAMDGCSESGTSAPATASPSK